MISTDTTTSEQRAATLKDAATLLWGMAQVQPGETADDAIARIEARLSNVPAAFADSEASRVQVEGEGEAGAVGVKAMLGLVAYVTGLPDELRWTKEFTRYVNGQFNEIAEAIRSTPAALASQPIDPVVGRHD